MADPALRALAAACPGAREAEDADAVAGVAPRYVASPSSAAEASALLRAAAELDLAVVARGSGSKLGWGVPPRRCDLVVDMLRLDQVVEHAAGDLVARVQAGAGLGRLGEVLAGAGQQLALDPPPHLGPPGVAADGVAANGVAAGGLAPGDVAADGPTAGGVMVGGVTAGGTVGGTLATAAAGPRRLRYGTPRDLVIGLTVVRADGTIARSGGKVVKNVAGYDLGRLFTGSFGTLGLIVEAVFRLHPLPQAAAYVTVDCPGTDAAHRAVAVAAASVLAPSAIEIDRPGRDRAITVCVLLEGEPAGVRERAELMAGLLGGHARTGESAPPWWGWPGAGAVWHGNIGPGGESVEAGTLVRVGFWAGALPRVLAAIDGAAREAGLDPAVGGSAAAGVIYAAVPPGAAPAAAAGFVSALRTALAAGGANGAPVAPPDGPPATASAVIVSAPAAVRDLADLWGPVPSLPLMRAVKDQFDPGHRLAPGRFVGGI